MPEKENQVPSTEESPFEVMYKALAAPFPKESIHWRAQTLTKDGKKALALAYVDSRDVMDLLDEVVGVGNWQCEYKYVGGNRLACGIGIYHGEMGWIWKYDGAGESAVEAEKGAFSDSFKRAGVKWGIARYLYAMGATWVPCETYDAGGKKKFSKFSKNPWDYVNAPEQEKTTAGEESLRVELRKFIFALNQSEDQAQAKLTLIKISEGLRYSNVKSTVNLSGVKLVEIHAEAKKLADKEAADRESSLK